MRHEMGQLHPESPARLQAIEDQLILARLSGLIEERSAPLATPEDILRVHTPTLLALVRDCTPTEPGKYYPLDGDTFLNHASYQAALRASGAAIAATDAVLKGELSNAFCAVRPPGHHASPTTPMGFCLFNHVAIAARYALDVHGLERVAIVDFDVHDGNGTVAAFEGDDRVLIAGLYQDNLYPYTSEQALSATRINVPLASGSNALAVREAIEHKWLPALHAFRPQLLLVSAGFDAHRDDEMGTLGLVEADFAWITRQIKAVADRHCGGRIVSCLEGGYDPSALARSVVAHLKVLADLE